eukprot:TRINITY_DN30956_c0_g1_i1.p1 TRINITY_DN30956_c0_g1~~TRINITY_DN30956_c0_g1_i1.p1  ORF type:complete len:899 (+),score=277.68 TRINITY_DN30956_c0_g1_i1:66-2699(+)
MAAADEGKQRRQPSAGSERDYESHVAVCNPPLKTFLPIPPERGRVYYDECNEELIVVQGNNIQISPMYRQGTRELNSLHLDNHCHAVGRPGTSIRGAKRSLGKSWLAVLKTDKTIIFYDLSATKSKPFAGYECKQTLQLARSIPGGNKRNNVIKDFFWLSDTCIFVVTTTAMETFKVIPGKLTLQKLKHNATTTDYYVWNSRLKIFLCVNRDKPAWIKPFRIGQTVGISKFQKIKMDDAVAAEHQPDMCRHWQSFAGEPMPLYHMRIARLYGQPVILHVTWRQEIIVYTLRQAEGRWEKAASLNLYQMGPVSLNVVDNLVLVHNHTNRITQLYDYRLQAAPIAAPMPLANQSPPFQTSGGRVGELASPVSPPSLSACPVTPSEHFYSMADVTMVHPDKLLDLRSGRVHALALSVRGVAATFGDRRKCLDFLLHRWRSKQEVLSCVVALLRHGVSASAVPQVPLPIGGPQGALAVFDTLNSALAKGLRETSGDGVRAYAPAGVTRASQPGEDGRRSSASAAADAASLSREGSRDNGCAGEDIPRSPASSPGAESTSPRSPAAAVPADGVQAESGTPPGLDEGSLGCQRIDSQQLTTTTAPLGSPRAARAPGAGFAPLAGGGDGAAPPAVDGVVDCFDPQEVPDWMRHRPGTAVYPYYGVAESAAMGEWYTRADHTLVIEQIDMWRAVFTPIHEDGSVPPVRFHGLFMEYVRSLSANGMHLKDVLQRFLIDLLIHAPRPNYPRLHHYLQYHVIEDTVPTALQLLKLEEQYPPSLQLALDMLSRKKAHGEIVDVLLVRGHVVRAVEIMIHYQVKAVDLKYVMQCAVSSCGEDALALHALCLLLKRYSKAVCGNQGVSEEDRCAEFEERYSQLLGAPAPLR